MRAGVMFLVVGMVWGIEMGIRRIFPWPPRTRISTWSAAFCCSYSALLRMVPAARDSTLAKWQSGLHMLGAILFPVGVAVVIKKGGSFIVLPIIGSLIVLVATALFALIVFRTSRIR